MADGGLRLRMKASTARVDIEAIVTHGRPIDSR
jgi:hypothetical protein